MSMSSLDGHTYTPFPLTQLNTLCFSVARTSASFMVVMIGSTIGASETSVTPLTGNSAERLLQPAIMTSAPSSTQPLATCLKFSITGSGFSYFSSNTASGMSNDLTGLLEMSLLLILKTFSVIEGIHSSRNVTTTNLVPKSLAMSKDDSAAPTTGMLSTPLASCKHGSQKQPTAIASYPSL